MAHWKQFMAFQYCTYSNKKMNYWNEFKELYDVVDRCIFKKQFGTIHDLMVALRKHYIELSHVMNCYPAKNTKSRDEVVRSVTTGVNIQGQQGKQTLSQSIVDEALILSDLFDLNEYSAVDLLLAGEGQMQYFPGLTRGLVAVVIYYDGKRCLINCLRTLIQSCKGRTWTLTLPQDVQPMISEFTERLMNTNDITDKILQQLHMFQLNAEIERLQNNRGLGKAKHRRQVTDMIKEIRLSTAECLFNWACQSGMQKDDVLLTIRHLRTNVELETSGTLDDVSLCLLMSVLYSFDVSILEEENEDDVMMTLPILTSDDFVSAVHDELMQETLQWKVAGIKAVLQFAWSLTLRSLSRHADAQKFTEYCEVDEYLAEVSVNNRVFLFIAESIISSKIFHKEEFYVRKIHHLVTEFLIHMPLKVKELRNRGDEVARIVADHLGEGISPPANLPRDFEHLLDMLGKLYIDDTLKLQLSDEYWCSLESSMSSFKKHIQYRPPQRQISLHKFVRLAGDLLPPTLYIPYIRMLIGLATGAHCAHQCFSLLKSNGNSHGGQASMISWDHFFQSFGQYFNNLRQEIQPMNTSASLYHASHIRGITPLEIEGLSTVLRLIGVIAEQDEIARIALCENQNWMPIGLFFGLLRCNVPTLLKAEIYITLAAFAKTPELAVQLWQSIEASQLVPPSSSHSIYQQGAIQVELDEIESRNEEFPMIRAFLDLILVLVDVQFPVGLGGGVHLSGFHSYFRFIRDNIFLKCLTRAYKDPEEKWDIASKAMAVFHKLLSQYEISQDNFIDYQSDAANTTFITPRKPAGYFLTISLLNDSALFKMIMFIIDEAIQVLDCYASSNREGLASAALFCLETIQLVLERQTVFFNTLRESGASILATTLDRLLSGINPRSGKPDHLVNIARYINHNTNYPEHALSAVKILRLVCQTSQVQQELVGLISADQELSDELLHGFVECLETDEPENMFAIEATSDVDVDLTPLFMRCETREAIMKLLLQSCDMQAPNIAHYLLGFNTRQAVNKTNLQDPGVFGSPRTCLHSVLSVLDRGVGCSSGPQCHWEMPRMAELGYHLIYMLCANKDTVAATMRYLRTTEDFLYRHAQHLPFSHESDRSLMENLVLHQQSWLMKAIAIELRLTTVNRQRSHTQRLMKLLLDDSPSSLFTDAIDSDHLGNQSNTMSQMMFNLQFETGSGQIRRKVMSILESVSLSQPLIYPDMPQLTAFDSLLTEQAIASCCVDNVDGSGNYCDVKMLGAMLTHELDGIQFANTVQRIPIEEEIQFILDTVVRRNNVKTTLNARKNAFEAWGQVVEILLAACPAELLEDDLRQNVLFELLQELLMEISDNNAAPELTAAASGVILTLMSNVRQCFTTLKNETSMETTDHVAKKKCSRNLFSSALKVVFKGIVEHIVKTSASQQRVRANLYGALLYCLQLVQSPKTTLTNVTHPTGLGVEKVLTAPSTDKEFEKMALENLSSINSTNLMDTLCRDTCDGHEIIRVLALSTLDVIIQTDRSLSWLTFLQRKGYLQHLVESLVQDDVYLQRVLGSNPDSLRALYMFESKICLLTKIAMSATGARAALSCGIMKQLEQCCSLDMRPDVQHPDPSMVPQFEGTVPNTVTRYLKIFLPTLKLCLGIMSSLGIENQEAANQVMHFICAHADVFCTVLRNRNGHDINSLQELSLVTAVASRAIAFGDHEYFSSNVEFKVQVSRVQHLLVTLMPKFCRMDDVMQSLCQYDSESQALLKVLVLEVASSLMSFCRAIVSKSGNSGQSCQIMFVPSLNETFRSDLSGFSSIDGAIGSVYNPPNLSVVVHFLKQSVDSFFQVQGQYKHTLHKLNSLADLSVDELKEIIGKDELCVTSSGLRGTADETCDMKLSGRGAPERQQLARKQLQAVLDRKVNESQLCTYIVENCLFILWRHLEYYFIYCTPSDKGLALTDHVSLRQSHMRNLQSSLDPGISTFTRRETPNFDVPVTKEGLNQLKEATQSALNDQFFKRLKEIEQVYVSQTRYGFIEALIRRLKRLLKIHATLD